ncbi:MAG TPA: winged helix-turn-helix domain-containing protein, partial [Pyrinomonadaceae bacterium]
MESQDFEVYEFGPFRLDASDHILSRGGDTVHLTDKVFNILLLLVQRGGHLVTKEELMQQVWPDIAVEENNLTVGISALRKVLGESRASARYIQTVQGRGYRFVANVRSVDAAKGGRGKSTPADARGPLNSLAVVPFGLITADPGENYLGQGIADAIITKLGKIKQLRVPSTTAILRYSRSEVDLEEICQQFGVDAVLTGQIQKMGDVIRVTAQLAAARGWQVLWAEKFDESFTNIFAIEDKVSERVANTLVQNLSAGEQENLTRRYTNSAEAYRYYLEGRYFWSKRTEDGFKK